MNNFDDVIKYLEKDYELDISLDEKKTISIVIDEKITVQLETDESNTKLLIFSNIYTLDAGKYRENILFQSLKENDKYPYKLILGYLDQESALCAHNFIYLENLTEDTFIVFFSSFIDRAILIKNTLEKGLDLQNI